MYQREVLERGERGATKVYELMEERGTTKVYVLLAAWGVARGLQGGRKGF